MEAEEVDGEVVAPFVDVVGLVDVVGVEGVAEVCSDVLRSKVRSKNCIESTCTYGEEEGEGMIAVTRGG